MRRAALLAAAAALAACADINAQTASYASLTEAREAGAIADGWLPEGLPPGAYEIRIGYVPGTAARWGLFNFPRDEADMLERMLGEEIDLDGLSVSVPGRIGWWPVALRRTLDGESLRLAGLRGYRARGADLVVAVNWNQGRGYYWSMKG